MTKAVQTSQQSVSALSIRYKALLMACLFAIAIVVLLFYVKKPGTFNLGFIGNFESTNAQPQIEALLSVELAYEEFRRAYPDSFSLKVFPVDDSKDPLKIQRAYERLRNKCKTIIFVTNSTAFLAVYDEVHKNPDILHLAIGPTTSVINGQDDNVIRNCIDMEAEQKCIADFLNDKELASLLVVRENKKNEGYTLMAYNYFKKYYRGPIVHTTFSAMDVNLKDPMEKMKKGDFKYVYIVAGGVPREVGIVAQNMCKINPDIEIVITPWVRGPFLLEAVGRFADNLIIPSPLMLAGPNQEYRRYVDIFYKKHNYKPGYFAPLTYDMTKILLKSIYNCTGDSVDCMKKTILASTVTGTTGIIKFDRYGDVEGKLYFYKLSGDEYVMVQ